MMGLNYLMVFMKCHTFNTHINYIHKINNRLVFKIKDRFKLELQTPEFMELFGSTKN